MLAFPFCSTSCLFSEKNVQFQMAVLDGLSSRAQRHAQILLFKRKILQKSAPYTLYTINFTPLRECAMRGLDLFLTDLQALLRVAADDTFRQNWAPIYAIIKIFNDDQ